MGECLHWIPGWLRSDSDSPDLFEQISRDANETIQARLNAVQKDRYGNPFTDLTHEERLSITTETERLSDMHSNLMEMQVHLWNDHGLVCRGTIGDGNCGCEMLMSFSENVPASTIQGQMASRSDVLNIMAGYRRELGAMWESVAEDPFWQHVWHHFIGGRLDMRPWLQKSWLEQGPKTPPKAPQDTRLASNTPPKTSDPDPRHARLLDQGEPPIESVVVAIPAPDGDEAGTNQPSKKRRTGKPREPSELITTEKYFQKWLAEKGLTYKNWTQHHFQDFNLVTLASKRLQHQPAIRMMLVFQICCGCTCMHQNVSCLSRPILPPISIQSLDQPR